MAERTSFRRLAALLLCAVLLLTSGPAAYAEEFTGAAHSIRENLALTVDGGESKNVRTLHYAYDFNRYVSLRDVAAALSGTGKSIDVRIAEGEIDISTGRAYSAVGGEGSGFADTSPESPPYVTGKLRLNPIRIDGRPLRYQSFLGSNPAGKTDCYLSVTDLAMMLDLDMKVSSEGMVIRTDGGFTIDLDELRARGFYLEVSSALVGDADTGEIFEAWEPDLSVPIASTTKLMSCICIMDAIAAGEISAADLVTIPEEAALLSRSEDGTIAMTSGQTAAVPDLLYGMLLLSSNECALALAIQTAGSEEAFTERMTRRAEELGLSDSVVFYNCHGLPIFTDSLAASKIQNRMTARDMFLLCSCLLRDYPEIVEISSTQSAWLESFGIQAWNTNPLVYNLPGVVGLKTGTTNMSGACLVAAVRTPDAQGEMHTLIAMEFGAEDSVTRTTFTEELLRYGMQRLRQAPQTAEEPAAAESGALPEDAESLIRLVLDRL